MTDGLGARLRVLVVAASPALRAGLVSLLAKDRLLDPIVAERVELGAVGAATSAIVVDYSMGEPEETLSITEAFIAPLFFREKGITEIEFNIAICMDPVGKAISVHVHKGECLVVRVIVEL